MEIKLNTNIPEDRMSDGILAALNVIERINEATDNNITIDFSEVRNVSPLYILSLVIFFNNCDKRIKIVNISNYLQLIYFKYGIFPDKMSESEFIHIMSRYSNKTFIPIINFPSTKNKENAKDNILVHVESTIIEQLNIAPNVIIGLKYLLGEYIDNIIQHANSERGYISAQSYPDKGYIDICIADNGITLLGSYKASNDNDIENDLEAIQAANRGISTKNLPHAENRGYGIITSKKMLVDGLRGSLIMASGNALYIHNHNEECFIEITSDIRCNGTIIALRIPYVKKDFQYINYIEYNIIFAI